MPPETGIGAQLVSGLFVLLGAAHQPKVDGLTKEESAATATVIHLCGTGATVGPGGDPAGSF